CWNRAPGEAVETRDMQSAFQSCRLAVHEDWVSGNLGCLCQARNVTRQVSSIRHVEHCTRPLIPSTRCRGRGDGCAQQEWQETRSQTEAKDATPFDSCRPDTPHGGSSVAPPMLFGPARMIKAGLQEPHAGRLSPRQSSH